MLVSDLSRRPRLHFVTKFTALRADLATRCLVTEIPRKSGNEADAWRVPLWWDLSNEHHNIPSFLIFLRTLLRYSILSFVL